MTNRPPVIILSPMTTTRTDALTLAVAKAIAGAPVTLRALARRAGVSSAFLHRLAHRTARCTPRVAAAVAKALEGIAEEAGTEARRVRRAHTRGQA